MILQWDESFDIGSDTLTGVNDADYKPPFPLTAKLNKLTIKIDRPQLSPADIQEARSSHEEQKLDAAYANPNPLPFSRAEATLEGKAIKLFFEIRAGGYNGSTYTLTYDPAADVLKGVYFQAVAQQKFDVYFARLK
jgi:hypothetical protein